MFKTRLLPLFFIFISVGFNASANPVEEIRQLTGILKLTETNTTTLNSIAQQELVKVLQYLAAENPSVLTDAKAFRAGFYRYIDQLDDNRKVAEMLYDIGRSAPKLSTDNFSQLKQRWFATTDRVFLDTLELIARQWASIKISYAQNQKPIDFNGSEAQLILTELDKQLLSEGATSKFYERLDQLQLTGAQATVDNALVVLLKEIQTDRNKTHINQKRLDELTCITALYQGFIAQQFLAGLTQLKSFGNNTNAVENWLRSHERSLTDYGLNTTDLVQFNQRWQQFLAEQQQYSSSEGNKLASACQSFYVHPTVTESDQLDAFIRALEIDFYAVRRLLSAIPSAHSEDLDLSDKKQIDPLLNQLLALLTPEILSTCQNFDDDCLKTIAIQVLATQSSFDEHLEFLETVLKPIGDQRQNIAQTLLNPELVNALCDTINIASKDCQDDTNPYRLSCAEQQQVAAACQSEQVFSQIEPLLKLMSDIHAAQKQADTVLQIETQLAEIRDALLKNAQQQLVQRVIDQALSQKITLTTCEQEPLCFGLRPQTVTEQKITAELFFILKNEAVKTWIKTGLTADIPIALNRESLNIQDISALSTEISALIQKTVEQAMNRLTFDCASTDDCQVLRFVGWDGRVVPKSVQFSVTHGLSIDLFQAVPSACQTGCLPIPVVQILTINQKKLTQQLKTRLSGYLKTDAIIAALHNSLPLVDINKIKQFVAEQQALFSSVMQICPDNQCVAKLRVNLANLDKRLVGHLVFHLTNAGTIRYAAEDSYLNLIDLLKSSFADAPFIILDNCEQTTDSARCDVHLKLNTGYHSLVRVQLQNNQLQFDIQQSVSIPLAGGFALQLKPADPLAVMMGDLDNKSSQIQWHGQQLSLKNVDLNAPMPFRTVTGIDIQFLTKNGQLQVSMTQASKAKLMKMFSQAMTTYLPNQLTEIVDLEINSALQLKLKFSSNVQQHVKKVIEQLDGNWLTNVQQQLYSVHEQFKRFLADNFNVALLKKADTLDIGVGQIHYQCDNPTQRQISISGFKIPSGQYYQHCRFTLTPAKPAPDCPLTFIGSLDNAFQPQFDMPKNDETLRCLKQWVKQKLPEEVTLNHVTIQFDAIKKRALWTMPLDWRGMKIPLQLGIDLEANWFLKPSVSELSQILIANTIKLTEQLAFAKSLPGLLALISTDFDLRSLGVLTAQVPNELKQISSVIDLAAFGKLGFSCQNPQVFGKYARYQSCQLVLKTTQPFNCQIKWRGRLGIHEKVVFETDRTSSCDLNALKAALNFDVFGRSAHLSVKKPKLNFPQIILPMSVTLPSLVNDAAIPFSTELNLLFNINDLQKFETQPTIGALAASFAEFETQNASKVAVKKLAAEFGDDVNQLLADCESYQQKLADSLTDSLTYITVLKTQLEPGCPKDTHNLLRTALNLNKQTLVADLKWQLPNLMFTLQNVRYSMAGGLDLSQARISADQIRQFVTEQLSFPSSFVEIEMIEPPRFDKTALLLNLRALLKLDQVGLEPITVVFETRLQLNQLKVSVQSDFQQLFIQSIRQTLWKNIATQLKAIGDIDLGGAMAQLKPRSQLVDFKKGIVDIEVKISEYLPTVTTQLEIPLYQGGQLLIHKPSVDFQAALQTLIDQNPLDLPEIGPFKILADQIVPLWNRDFPVGVKFGVEISLPNEWKDIPFLKVAFPIIVTAKIDQSGLSLDDFKGFSIPLGPEIPIPPVSLCNPKVTFTDEAIRFIGDLTLAQCSLKYLLNLKGEFAFLFDDLSFTGDGNLVAFYIIPLGRSQIELDVPSGVASQTLDIGGALSSIIRLQGSAFLSTGQNHLSDSITSRANHCEQQAASQLGQQVGIAGCTDMSLFKIPVTDAQFFLTEHQMAVTTLYDVFGLLSGTASFQTEQAFRNPHLSMSSALEVGGYTLADADLGVALNQARLGFSFTGIQLGLTVSELDELSADAILEILKRALALPSLEELKKALSAILSGNIQLNPFSSFGEARGGTFGKHGDSGDGSESGDAGNQSDTGDGENQSDTGDGESESDTGSDGESESDTDSDGENQSDTGTDDGESESDTSSDDETESDTGTDDEEQSDTGTDAENKLDIGTDVENQLNIGLDDENQLDTGTDAEDTGTDAENQSDTDTDADDGESESDIGTDAENQSDTGSDGENQSDTDSDADDDVEDESDTSTFQKGDFKDLKELIQTEEIDNPNYQEPEPDSKPEVLSTAKLFPDGKLGWLIRPYQDNLLVINLNQKDQPEKPIAYVPKQTTVTHFQPIGERFTSAGTTVLVGKGAYAHFLEQNAEVDSRIKTVSCSRPTTLYWFVKSAFDSADNVPIEGRSFAGAWQYPYADDQLTGLCYDTLKAASNNTLRREALMGFFRGASGVLATQAANQDQSADFITQVTEFKAESNGKPLHVIAVNYQDYISTVFYIAGWQPKETVTLWINGLDSNMIATQQAFTKAVIAKALPIQQEYRDKFSKQPPEEPTDLTDCPEEQRGWPGMSARVRNVGGNLTLETPLRIWFWQQGRFADSMEVDITQIPTTSCPTAFFPAPSEGVELTYAKPEAAQKMPFPWWDKKESDDTSKTASWYQTNQKASETTFKVTLWHENQNQEVTDLFELIIPNTLNGFTLFSDDKFNGSALYIDPQRHGFATVVPNGDGNECAGTLWWFYQQPENPTQTRFASVQLQGPVGDLCNGNQPLGFDKLQALWDDQIKGRAAFLLLLNLMKYTSEQVLFVAEPWNEQPIESARLLRNSQSHVQGLLVKFHQHHGVTLFGFNSPTISAVELFGNSSLARLDKRIQAGDDDALQFMTLVRQQANDSQKVVIFDTAQVADNQNQSLFFIAERLYAALIGNQLYVPHKQSSNMALFELTPLVFDNQELPIEVLAGEQTQIVDDKEVPNRYAREAIQVGLTHIQSEPVTRLEEAVTFTAEYTDKRGKVHPFATFMYKQQGRYVISMQGSVPNPALLVREKRQQTRAAQCRSEIIENFEKQVLKPWVTKITSWNDSFRFIQKMIEDEQLLATNQQDIINQYFQLLKTDLSHDQVFVALDCYLAQNGIAQSSTDERSQKLLRELQTVKSNPDQFDDPALTALAKLLLAIYQAEYFEYEKDVLSQGDCRKAKLAIHSKRTVNGKPLTLDEIKATPIFKALFAENDCQADISGDYYLVNDTTFRVENGQLSYWQHSDFKTVLDSVTDQNPGIFIKWLQESKDFLIQAQSLKWVSNQALLVQHPSQTYLYTIHRREQTPVRIQLVYWHALTDENQRQVLSHLQTTATVPSYVHIYQQDQQLLLWQDNRIYHLTDQFEVGKVEQKIDRQPFNQQILGWIRDRLQQDSACRIDSHFYNNTFKQTGLLGLQWKDCATLSAEIHTIYSPQYQTPLTFRTPNSHPKNFSDSDFEILFDWNS